MGTLVLIHEEPRRGIITFEMLVSHNFLQPTVLGEPYFKKPPFHNWVLALFSLLFGSVKELSLRLPSALSVVGTSLLLFFLGRELVGVRGALFGALIYPTFFVVLIGYGTKCEPDTLFSFLVTGATFGWLFWFKRGRELLGWLTGYGLTSLALLTKGLPALQFFYFFILSYFIVFREWRRLLTKEHLLGAVIGTLPFVAWLSSVNCEIALKTLFSEVLSRAPGELPLLKSLKRILTYPFRLISATLPWSLIALFYAFKRELPQVKDGVLKVLALAFLLDALLYWLFPGSRLRYLMPALPAGALLLGVLLKDAVVLHKRAREVLRFTAQIIVLIGIVAGVAVSGSPSLTLKSTLTFILFLYGVYFLLAPRFNFTYTVALWALLALIFRGFYSSYFYPIAQLKYPPVREVAAQIVADSSGYSLYTKSRYLQLCFYVERGRGELLKFSPAPPREALFLSQKREGNVLREYILGRRKFYLCSYSVRSLQGKIGAEEGLLKRSPERQSRSKEKGGYPQG